MPRLQLVVGVGQLLLLSWQAHEALALTTTIRKGNSTGREHTISPAGALTAEIDEDGSMVMPRLTSLSADSAVMAEIPIHVYSSIMGVVDPKFARSLWASSTSHDSREHVAVGQTITHFNLWMLIVALVVFSLHMTVRCLRGWLASERDEDTEENAALNKAQHDKDAKAESKYRQLFKAFCFVAAWVVVSIFIVLSNKWLFTKGGFPHPLYLTMCHQISCYSVFTVFRFVRPVKTAYMPDANKDLSWLTYFTRFVPIALLNAYCVGAGNLAFTYCSVPLLQMIKPINILWTSLAAFACGLEPPTSSHGIIIWIIIGGVVMAAYQGVQGSLIGIILQLSATFCSGVRLVLLQKLMTKDMRLDPVTTIYNEMPVAVVGMGVAAYLLEKPFDIDGLSSATVLALVFNICLAVVLNILIMNVIRTTSAVAFTLIGIVKDIGTVIISAVMFKDHLGSLQVAGYTVSISGMLLFKHYKDNLELFQEHGFLSGMVRSLSAKEEKQVI